MCTTSRLARLLALPALLAALLAPATPAPRSTSAALAAPPVRPASSAPSAALADAGQNVWASVGPYGGDLNHVVIDPLTPTTLYAGSSSNALFKSTDGAASWLDVTPGVDGYNAYALVIDPLTPTTLYAGGYNLFKSTDGAASWQRIGQGQISDPVYTLAVDPVTPTTLYLGGENWSGPALYKSTDGGASWQPSATGIATMITDLAVAPSQPSTIYAVGYAVGSGSPTISVYKSTNGGTSWSSIAAGIDPSLFPRSLTVDPTNADSVYLGTNLALYHSTNGGASWAALSDFAVEELEIDPATPTTLYAISPFGVYRSTNGGASWTTVSTGLSSSNKNDLAIDPRQTGTLYLATYNGIYKSTNGGGLWVESNQGLSATAVGAMVADPANPQTIFIGTSGGVYRSTDGGATWALKNQGLGWNLFIYSLAIAPVDPLGQVAPGTPMIYAGTSSGAIFRSTDLGESWEPYSTLPGYVHELIIDPFDPRIFYARLEYGIELGIFKSTDAGQTWALLTGSIPPDPDYDNWRFKAFEQDPAVPTTLYAGLGVGIYKSTDGGVRWATANDGLPSFKDVTDIAVDPVTPARLFACVSGAIYQSSDGAASWRWIPRTAGCNKLLVDPTSHTTVYAGVASGVYRSTDGGLSWNTFAQGQTVRGASSLALIPSSPIRLYAGTDKAGVYSLSFSVGGVEVPAPRAVVAGAPFDLTVRVLDLDGQLAAYDGPVSIALRGPGTPPALLGATTASASGGSASFTGLSIGAAATGVQLSVRAGDLAAGLSPVFSVAATAGISSGSEREPDDGPAQATPLLVGADGTGVYTGTIGGPDDVDYFRLATQPGATVRLSLDNLPADYDLLLLGDPAEGAGRDDALDLGNISDIARDLIARDLIARDLIARDLIARDLISGASSTPGKAAEAIEAFRPTGGNAFVLIYGANRAHDAARPYTLSLQVQEGAMGSPVLTAQAGRGSRLQVDPAVTTVYLANFARMEARYGQAAVAPLRATLSPTGTLLGASHGALLDISSGLDPAAASRLAALYSRWDAAPDQPLLANELAQQIWFLLDKALGTYYPATTDLVIVGGDEVIPFYRVPDETDLGNERDYALRLGPALASASPLGGSLRFGFYQTDDFYADRKPTAWRGRLLFVPDQAIGRLVESPDDIERYLRGYVDAPPAERFVIRADAASAGQYSGGALVTGYNFLSDQARAISTTLAGLGFDRPGFAFQSLVNDQWDSADLTDLWFGGQLDQLTGAYAGPHTPYQLMSINSHFTHFASEPATLDGGLFTARRLLEPTPASSAALYFRRGGGPTLIYSVGCHSGLSATDAAFSDPGYQADFAQAVLRQGGNWIGNTGYGIGDTDWVGYSERLALLFTRNLGRALPTSLAYTGAPIGESLALAKRQYLQSSGPSGFGVFDEKVIAEMTLYGLPFLRVAVPAPVAVEAQAPPQVPAAVQAGLAQSGGVFTRELTITIAWSDPVAAVPQPDEGGIAISDSFSPTARELVRATVAGRGRPVLPALVYDLTLAPTTVTASTLTARPEVRGVRLIDAVSLPDIADFSPHVTTPITDHVGLWGARDTPMERLDVWLPAQSYTFQRTASVIPGGDDLVGSRPTDQTDKLIVVPAQVYATTPQMGRLRRFASMTFAVTYVDPRTASSAVLADTSRPAFVELGLDQSAPAALVAELGLDQSAPAALVAAAAPSATLRARLAADPEGASTEVYAVYTADGQTWERVRLERGADGGYAARVADGANPGALYAFFEASDVAGNVTPGTVREGLALRRTYAPVVIR